MKRQALILASGRLNPEADMLIKKVLEPFIHEVLEQQRIDIAGHTIIATLIKIDPAHADSILADLRENGGSTGLDFALEIQDEAK